MQFRLKLKHLQGRWHGDQTPWNMIQEAELRDPRRTPTTQDDSVGVNDEAGSGGCRCVIVRMAQVGLSASLLVAASYTLIAAINTALVPSTPTPNTGRPSIIALLGAWLPDPPPSTLLDLTTFHYLHEAEGVCSNPVIHFVFLVHSRPDHFRQRQAIRSTWGNLGDLGGGKVVARAVFMLGAWQTVGVGVGVGGLDVAKLIEAEALRNGDLVVGSFQDSYHNLTYKHVMALRWAATHCAHATFVVKCDDDAFIDVFSLKALLNRTFPGTPPPGLLACHVLPPGTPPQREGKWAVSPQDYPWPEYPRYCAGLAYVATVDVAVALVRAAHAASNSATRLWVDDVWVTGMLAEALQLEPHYLNLRYTYDHDELLTWLKRARPLAPPPYIFAHLDAARPDWRLTLERLWQHALGAAQQHALAAAHQHAFAAAHQHALAATHENTQQLKGDPRQDVPYVTRQI